MYKKYTRVGKSRIVPVHIETFARVLCPRHIQTPHFCFSIYCLCSSRRYASSDFLAFLLSFMEQLCALFETIARSFHCIILCIGSGCDKENHLTNQRLIYWIIGRYK